MCSIRSLSGFLVALLLSCCLVVCRCQSQTVNVPQSVAFYSDPSCNTPKDIIATVQGSVNSWQY